MGVKINSLPTTTDALTGDEICVAVKDGKTIKFRLGDLREVVLNITPTSLGLENVDNTRDMDKPVSTAMAEALADKSDRGHKHQISDVYDLHNRLASAPIAGPTSGPNNW